jgi:hypothetical protein
MMRSCTLFEPLEQRRFLAATYYISPSGDDASNGRSPATAWQTIQNLNWRNAQPGDQFLFEGGKTFFPTGSAGAEILTNSGFESGLDGWDETLGTAPELSVASNESVHSGGSALKLSGTSTPTMRGQDVTASMVGNQAYEIGAWTRVTNLGAGERRVGITFYLDDQPVATFYRGTAATSWAQFRFQFVSPRNFNRAVLWGSRRGDNATLYVDNVTLRSIPNGIVLDETDAGTPEAPVTIGSYGAGKPIISAGDGIGLWGGNVEGVSVENLVFTGSWNSTTGTGANAGVGVEFVNTRTDNSKLLHINIKNVEARGFQWAGIRVGGWAAKSGFRNVFITDCVAEFNGDNGIIVRGEFDKASTLYANERVFLTRCVAQGNTGIPLRWGNSGNGILLQDVNGGYVERCVAHGNGALSDYNQAGPIGIFAYDATRITFKFNESHSNKTKSNRDGAGFDFDGGVTDSIMLNNYAHDNDGAGFLLGQFSRSRGWGRNIIRHNISHNDARRNSYGAITLTGGPGPSNAVVEHNTIFITPPISGVASGIRVKWAGSGVQIRNNIIQTAKGVTLVEVDSSGKAAQFNGNFYWASGRSFNVGWSGTYYTSLDEWRAISSRETGTGHFLDPRLRLTLEATTLNDAYQLKTLTAYIPKPGSPVIGAKTELAAPFATYASSTIDFFGRGRRGSNWDVGAIESQDA